MDREVPFPIWVERGLVPSKQEGIAILYQYVVTGINEFRHYFHGHSQLLHVGVSPYNFVVGDRFVNPGQNPACPTGGFLVWTSLQGVEDMGDSIAASNSDIEVLDGKNAAADQIILAARVILWVLVRKNTAQKELGTYWYLLDLLLGPWCPLIWTLR